MVCIVKVAYGLKRHLAYLFPAILDCPELREGGMHILILLKESLKIFNHSLFLGQILFFHGFNGTSILSLLLLISIEHGLEILFHRIKGLGIISF